MTATAADLHTAAQTLRGIFASLGMGWVGVEVHQGRVVVTHPTAHRTLAVVWSNTPEELQAAVKATLNF